MKGTFRFTGRERITHSEHFKRVMKLGKRLRFKNVTLFILPNENQFHRLGLVVKKEVGTAAYRNRIKRYFREFFRLYKHQIHGSSDMIFLVRKGWAIRRYKEVEGELRRLFNL